MERLKLVEKVQGLTDLELAILLSLVAGQHCMIQAEQDELEPLEQELQLIASNVFGLTHAVLHCNESTSLEEFSHGVLVPINDENIKEDAESVHSSTSPSKFETGENDWGIANVVIITGLSTANERIQIQALELLRTKRIFTHTAVHTAPKSFLLVFIKPMTDPALVHHLNDYIFISHYHDAGDGFVNLEEASEWIEDDLASLSSVVHRSAVPQSFLLASRPHHFTQENIRTLAELSGRATINAEIRAYLQNIVTFLRMHRAVGGGISPRATQQFNQLVKCLAPLHDLEFVTPSLVALAARKIYSHRIVITTARDERSMQYGSDLAAVATMLEGMNPEQVIESVLEEVEVPL